MEEGRTEKGKQKERKDVGQREEKYRDDVGIYNLLREYGYVIKKG